MARKKINPDDEIDFDLLGDDDDASDGSESDPLFANYYTPTPPDDEDAPEDETFIEASERENEQMLGDFKEADEHFKKSVLRENKNAVSSGVDTNYYFSIVFVSEEQMNAFFDASGWDQYGGRRFLNGILLANDMDIELPPSYLATEAKPDKVMSKFIRKE